MIKKIFLLLLLFFLYSCWSDSTNTSNTWLQLMDKADFSIYIPENWDILDDSESLPKPSYWEVVLASNSTDYSSGYSNNLVILKDKINSLTTSKEYTMLNNVWARADYIDYTAIETKDITFADWEVSLLYVFEAKYNMDTPKMKFLQTSSICAWTEAYFMTISIPTTVSDTSKYEYLLSTFSCK